MESRLQWIDPDQLVQIADLQLLARSVVDGLLSGIHRSPYFGSSIEFAQYRPYVQGDDPRFVDWSLYARTDRLHVKQFHDETNLRCSILLDCSASMNYGSGSITKFQYARMLAACLAMILHKQKDAVGLFAFRKDKELYIPPRSLPHHYRRIMTELANLEAEGPTEMEKGFHDLGDALKPRGMVVFVSDLLYSVEAIIGYLKLLKARKQEVMILQITDIAEQTFPFDRTVTLVDVESAQEQYMIPQAARDLYLENRQRHFESIRDACLPLDIEIEEFVTSEPLDRALRFFLQARNRNLALSTRRNSAARGGG